MVAIYARQSLDKKDSLSIEGQIDLCRRYAGEEVRIFQDKGYSGKNTRRPAFTELMEQVRAGQIQKILVYRLDRFSRSIADFSQVWTELERCGVAFQSVTEQFDTASPMGRAMLNIVMTFAQLERETTAERVKDNYRHRVDLGAWPGGPAPFGYDLTKTADGEGRVISTLAANESAHIVQEIFRRYCEPGVSLRGLARELTEKGVPAPRRKTWDNVTISRILHNPSYVMADADVYWHFLAQGVPIAQPVDAFDGSHGCILVGKRDRGKSRSNTPGVQRLSLACHLGMIPSDLWLSVQDKLAGNRQLDRAQAGKHSWLTGLLKCGRCGYAVKINYDRRRDRYSLLCSGRSNLVSCDASIRLDLRELENGVEQALGEVLSQCPPEDLLPEDHPAAPELERTEKKIERLVAALAESSGVSVQYISREIQRLHQQRESLLAQQRSWADRRGEQNRVDISLAGPEEKKLIAAVFLEKVLVEGERVTLIWNA